MRRPIFDGFVTVEVEIVGYLDGGRMKVCYPGGGTAVIPRSFLVEPGSVVVEVQPAAGPGVLRESQFRVLRALANAGAVGLLDDEHQELHNMPATGAGKRRLELMRLGYVAKNVAPHDRRKTRWGSEATVWVITDAGRSALRAHELLLVSA